MNVVARDAPAVVNAYRKTSSAKGPLVLMQSCCASSATESSIDGIGAQVLAHAKRNEDDIGKQVAHHLNIFALELRQEICERLEAARTAAVAQKRKQ